MAPQLRNPAHRSALALAATLANGLVACGTGPHDLADFVDVPFGPAVAEVRSLDRAALEPVMSELQTRFRSYLALREAIPFAGLVSDPCLSDLSESVSFFSFDLDVACAFGGERPASGAIRVHQEAVSAEVTTLDLDYRAVRVGALTVDGTEAITETDGTNGTSVRRLDLVQDGVAFDYEFRIGVVDGDETVIDYRVELPGGAAQARLTSGATVGALATVHLTGVDGTLTCELRDTAWEPGATAKGLCDNGVVFGMPTPP